MELKKGQRANPKMMEALGYSQLSSSTWIKDGVKVQVVFGRIHNLQNQTKYKKIHRHGITYDDRKITGWYKEKQETPKKKSKKRKAKERKFRKFLGSIGAIK